MPVERFGTVIKVFSVPWIVLAPIACLFSSRPGFSDFFEGLAIGLISGVAGFFVALAVRIIMDSPRLWVFRRRQIKWGKQFDVGREISLKSIEAKIVAGDREYQIKKRQQEELYRRLHEAITHRANDSDERTKLEVGVTAIEAAIAVVDTILMSLTILREEVNITRIMLQAEVLCDRLPMTSGDARSRVGRCQYLATEVLACRKRIERMVLAKGQYELVNRCGLAMNHLNDIARDLSRAEVSALLQDVRESVASVKPIEKWATVSRPDLPTTGIRVVLDHSALEKMTVSCLDEAFRITAEHEAVAEVERLLANDATRLRR